MGTPSILGKKEVRRQRIVELLASTPLSSIAQLAQELGVSDETIRTDLKSTELRDQVIQAHGSVALGASSAGTGVPFQFRRSVNTQIKTHLANRAAELISPGSTVAIEHSGVGSMLAEAIVDRPELSDTITLITNSFPIIALLIERHSRMRTVFLGGRFIEGQLNTYGSTTIDQMSRMHGDMAFLSPAAVSGALAVTGFVEDDMAFKTTLMCQCSRSVLLLDKSKMGKTALLDINHVYDYDYVVTDADFDTEQRQALADHNASVIDIRCPGAGPATAGSRNADRAIH